MQIIAVSNYKGGVGKTTTAVNLAYLCAASGRRTVLWDLDPQGAATYMLRGEPNERASARKLVAGKRELPELIAARRRSCGRPKVASPAGLAREHARP
jgi:chromosome partitioning protein